MRNTNYQNMGGGPEGMKQLLDYEKQKLQKWQQVKENQSSKFKQDLQQFQTEIETRKTRLQRIMGSNAINKRIFNNKIG